MFADSNIYKCTHGTKTKFEMKVSYVCIEMKVTSYRHFIVDDHWYSL